MSNNKIQVNSDQKEQENVDTTVGNSPSSLSSSKASITNTDEGLKMAQEAQNGSKSRKVARKSLSVAKKICICAVATALLSGGKMALAAIPNVEVVTLLCAVYGYSLGILGIVSVLAFVIIEVLIWGFGTWVFSYFLYFPFVCAFFMLLRPLTKSRRIIPTVLAFILTVYFSFLTSFVDVTLFYYFDDFWLRFWIYFARGIPFYITQIVCNLILFPLLFSPLTKVLDKTLFR